MAKRLTDTGKWDKQWFMSLSPKLKCLWQYINDKCDQAGVWEMNFTLASIYIGETVTAEDLKYFGHRVEEFKPGKLWITGHVDFQCGELSEKCVAHKPVFKLLKKYSLLNRVLVRVSNTQQEKEKEIEIEKDMEMEEEKYITVSNEKIYNVTRILEHKEASLNGRQREHNTRNWKEVAKEWLETVVQHDFKDETHVFNTFSKYLISYGKPPTGPGQAKNGVHKLTMQDLQS